MGKSVTPKYRIEGRYNDNSPFHFIWDGKRFGKPTLEKLKQWRDECNESYKLGGVNEHLSINRGYVLFIKECKVVNQFTDEVVTSYTMPLFEEF